MSWYVTFKDRSDCLSILIQGVPRKGYLIKNSNDYSLELPVVQKVICK